MKFMSHLPTYKHLINAFENLSLLVYSVVHIPCLPFIILHLYPYTQGHITFVDGEGA